MNWLSVGYFRYARISKGKSIRLFAEELGVNASTISRIERGLQRLRYTLIKKLEIRMNCKVQELIGRSRVAGFLA